MSSRAPSQGCSSLNLQAPPTTSKLLYWGNEQKPQVHRAYTLAQPRRGPWRTSRSRRQSAFGKALFSSVG